MQRVGFTTTIPLEVIVAAGKTPVDLNNFFIAGEQVPRFVEEAEMAGFPRNTCGWIKGIFTAVMESGIREMVAVTEGDCSYTKALMELLSLEGVTVIPFAYPHGRDRETLRFEIEKLMRHFSVGWEAVYQAKERLDRIRHKVREIDRLTWEENVVSGMENHYFQVATSDMNSAPDAFEAEVDTFLREARCRTPLQEKLRLAYIGVPPIFDDLYTFLESQGGRVVFNETQRQFAMPYDLNDLVEQYLRLHVPLRHLSPPVRHHPGSGKKTDRWRYSLCSVLLFPADRGPYHSPEASVPHIDPGGGQTDPPRCEDENQDRGISRNARGKAGP